MAAEQDWSHSGPEPQIEDMIHDPIVQLIMRRDRLTIAQIMTIVTQARTQLQSSSEQQAVCPDPVTCAFRSSP